MKVIFFLVPFLLVAGLGINANAETTVSQDYTNITFPNGTGILQSHYPYILDGNNWVPFIQSGTQIETNHGSVILDANGLFNYYPNGKINSSPLFDDSIKAKYADVSNLTAWTYPATLNNASPVVSWDGNQLTSAKTKSGVGDLKYKYILNNGVWKTQLEATNLSALTTKAFGFDQTININSDFIKFGGVTRNLDNFDGQTFSKAFLDANQGKMLDLLNGQYYDFDLAYQYLYSITVHNTGVGKSQLVFDFRTSTPLLPGQTLVLDPTYTDTTSSNGRAYSQQAIGTSCPATVDAKDTTFRMGKDDSDLSNRCITGWLEFDISGLDPSWTVTSATLEYDVTTATLATACTWREATVQPSIGAAQTLYDNARSGTALGASDTACTTVSDGKIFTFGAAGITNIQTKIDASQSWYGMTVFYTDQARVPTGDTITIFRTNDAILSVTYVATPPPDPVDDLTYTNLTANSLDLLWTQPALNGGTLQGYKINYTSPYGTPTSFLANTTNTYYNVTGLTFGTEYSFRVSAATEGGYNTTGATILNVTTSSTTYPTTPTSLVASSSSSSQIDLQWVAPTGMTNINGYKIQRETPIGTGWSTIVSNTTNSNIYYNNTGLSTNIIYNYRVYALNGTGISQASNEYDMTTFHLPNAVTDLVGTATSYSTVDLSWSVPTSYAPEITGYRINYTTPEGNPDTIITPDPAASTNSYTVTNLQIGVTYSLRVAPITVHGTNASGNIVNVTTNSFITLGNLTSGQTTNTDDFKIFFSRTDVNSTDTILTVTYPNTYDLDCNFQYQFSLANDTYTGLTQTVVDADNVKSTFEFVNPQNDIIHVKCWDTITEDEARYVIVINQFPFLDQISNLRNGTYGTYFQIGAIDGVTLCICILAMIGFNRTNPLAGIIFLVITVGVLSWFEIITYPIVMYPALALLMVWAYFSTRKDD